MKQTDLDGVKKVAKMFLAMNPIKTEMSPAIVKHPFTNSGYALVNVKEGVPSFENIMTEDGFEKWRKEKEVRIEKAKSVSEIFFCVTTSYCLVFLKYVQEYLSEKDFAETLAECWVREEQPNMNPNFTKTELSDMFKRADKEFLMSKKKYKKWQDLPDKVTIYRGVTEYNEKNVRVLSWTTNYETAKWFAGRFDEQGKIYQAEIDKKHILACIDKRGESEIIVEPKYLKDIEVVEDLSLTMTIQ